MERTKRPEVSWSGRSDTGQQARERLIVIKKVLAAGAVAAPIAGISATPAPQAMGIGNDTGTTSVNGSGSSQSFGNSETRGDRSPQFGLVQGSLNKPCVGMPAKVDAGSPMRRRSGGGPGRQRPVLAPEPAVHRELHPGQGWRAAVAHPGRHSGALGQRHRQQLSPPNRGSGPAGVLPSVRLGPAVACRSLGATGNPMIPAVAPSSECCIIRADSQESSSWGVSRKVLSRYEL